MYSTLSTPISGAQPSKPPRFIKYSSRSVFCLAAWTLVTKPLEQAQAQHRGLAGAARDSSLRNEGGMWAGWGCTRQGGRWLWRHRAERPLIWRGHAGDGAFAHRLGHRREIALRADAFATAQYARARGRVAMRSSRRVVDCVVECECGVACRGARYIAGERCADRINALHSSDDCACQRHRFQRGLGACWAGGGCLRCSLGGAGIQVGARAVGGRDTTGRQKQRHRAEQRPCECPWMSCTLDSLTTHEAPPLPLEHDR